MTTQHDKADLLRADQPLVLANAWDAASAAIVAAAGARAIATTSGGVAWSLGFPDGERLTRDTMIAAVARIAAAVDLPVTADVESGYGPGPADVAATVKAVVAAGAVGINLEDSRAPGGPLFDAAEQAARLAAARDAAVASGLPNLFVNVRTDVYLFGIGEPAGRLDDTLRRADAYAKAGADGLFVPGLSDLEVLADLAARTPLPVNAMAGPGGPTVAEFVAAGVRRISVGTAIAQLAYAAVRRAAQEILDHGTFDELADGIPFSDCNALFTR